MTSIKQEILDELAGNVQAKAKLSIVLNKHMFTVERYIKENNSLLTTQDSIKAIAEELGKTEQEILTES